jgi:hypothetical protein
MPDMRDFSATRGSDWRGLSTFAPVRFFLPWLRHCLLRMGCGQSGKVSKTVTSCVALLRCVRCVMILPPAVGASGRAFPRRCPTVGGWGLSPRRFNCGGGAQTSGEVSVGDQTTPRLCQARWCLTARLAAHLSGPPPRRGPEALRRRGSGRIKYCQGCAAFCRTGKHTRP